MAQAMTTTTTTERRERKQALQLNLEKVQVDYLDREACRRGVPISQVAREIMDHWLRQEASK